MGGSYIRTLTLELKLAEGGKYQVALYDEASRTYGFAEGLELPPKLVDSALTAVAGGVDLEPDTGHGLAGELGSVLFPGSDGPQDSPRTVLSEALKQAESHDELLRVEINVSGEDDDAAGLLGLPWELADVGRGNGHRLRDEPRLVLVRNLGCAVRTRSKTVADHVRVLPVMAPESKRDGTQIADDAESLASVLGSAGVLEAVRAAENPEEPTRLEVARVIDRWTADDLRSQLDALSDAPEEVTVFHFSGHGDRHRGGVVHLGTETLAVDEIADDIAGIGARVAVLAACHLSSAAPSLLSAGVDVVVAMQGPIADHEAQRFASALYAHWEANPNEPLDTAFLEARKSLHGESRGAPTLWTAFKDAQIQTIPVRQGYLHALGHGRSWRRRTVLAVVATVICAGFVGAIAWGLTHAGTEGDQAGPATTDVGSAVEPSPTPGAQPPEGSARPMPAPENGTGQSDPDSIPSDPPEVVESPINSAVDEFRTYGRVADPRAAIADANRAIDAGTAASQDYVVRAIAQGQLGLKEEALASAQEAVERASSEGPQAEAEARIARGAAVLGTNSGSIDSALRDADWALNEQPSAQGHLLRADALEQLGQSEQAIEAARSATELDPSPQTQSMLAWHLLRSGMEQEALGEASSAYDTTPNSLSAAVLGAINEGLDSQQTALQWYETANSLDPGYLYPVIHGSEIMESTEGSRSALNWIDERGAGNLDETTALARRRVDLLVDLGDFEEAEASLRRVADVGADDPRYWNSLGRTQRLSAERMSGPAAFQSLVDAVQALEQASLLDNDWATPSHELGLTIDGLAQLLDESPSDGPDGWVAAALAAVGDELRSAALAHHASAAELDPQWASPLVHIAGLERSLGHPRTARDYLESAIELSGEWSYPYERLGDLLLWDLDSPEEAIDHLTTAIESGDSTGGTLATLGTAQRAADDSEAALETFRRAAEASPSWYYPEQEVAGALADLGRHHEALDHIDRAEELASEDGLDDAVAHLELERTHRFDSLGRTTEALQGYVTAATHEPAAWYGVGKMLYRLGDGVGALAAFDEYHEALEGEPAPDAEWLDYWRGRALLAVDANERAVEAFDRESIGHKESSSWRVARATAGWRQNPADETSHQLLVEAVRVDAVFALDALDSILEPGEITEFELRDVVADAYRAAVTANPVSADLHRRRSDYLLEVFGVDRSLRALDEAIELDPENAAYYLRLKAAPLRRAGSPEEVLAILDQAVAADPKDAYALGERAYWGLDQLERYDEAAFGALSALILAVENEIDVGPVLRHYHWIMTTRFWEKGGPQQFREQVTELLPSKPGNEMWLAWTYLRPDPDGQVPPGDAAVAEEWATEATQHSPDAAEPWVILAQSLSHQSRHREALQAYRSAYERDGGALDVDTPFYQAGAVGAVGESAAAVLDPETAVGAADLIATAHAAQPDSAATEILGIAQALVSAGEREASVDVLRRALSLGDLSFVPGLEILEGVERSLLAAETRQELLVAFLWEVVRDIQSEF